MFDDNVMLMLHSVLGTCGVDMLLKIGTLLPEIAIYEKTIDSFIDLLRKDQVFIAAAGLVENAFIYYMFINFIIF